jgi:hypothetical protein
MNNISWYTAQFPEDMFQCLNRYKADYGNAIVRGAEIAAKSNVLICGIARNCARILPYTFARLEKLSQMFSSYHIFIYENDSKDATKSVLSQWNYPDVTIKAENLGAPVFTEPKSKARKIWMAKSRNKYLAFAKKYVTKHPVDYIVIVDMDLWGGWSYLGILNSLGQNFKWDVMGSNSIYYQIDTSNCEWVFENGKWRCKHCNFIINEEEYLLPDRQKINFWKDALIQPTIGSTNKATHEDLGPHHERLFYDTWALRLFNKSEELDDNKANLYQFNRGQSPFRVNSCFGGLAIYNPRFLEENIKYTSKDCDHPTLHNELTRRGYYVVFNPSQITLYNKSCYVI